MTLMILWYWYAKLPKTGPRPSHAIQAHGRMRPVLLGASRYLRKELVMYKVER
jgi:hypothetical protein